MAEVGPEVDVAYPLQRTRNAKRQPVTLEDPAEGTNTRLVGPVDATPMEISSTKIISSQAFELSGWICKRPIRVLLDSRSIGNYISDREARSFNLTIQPEEGNK